jgi:hypothetical protein
MAGPGWLLRLVLGTTLATVLAGVTAYGAGVNIRLGAARLQLAARAVDPGKEKRHSVLGI